MSRNTGQALCSQCRSEVTMTEPARRITPADCGPDMFRDYIGLCVAYAECSNIECGALYLAWVSAVDTRWYHSYGKDYSATGRDGFFDLSYRSTFNDEPGPEDLPNGPWRKPTVDANAIEAWQATCHYNPGFREVVSDLLKENGFEVAANALEELSRGW